MYTKPITAEGNSAVRQSIAAMKAIFTHCSTISNGNLFCDNLGESC